MRCEGSRTSFVTRPEDLPEILPVFPLSGVMLLPRGRLPLNIFEPRYLAMVEAALGQGRFIGMVQPTGETDGQGRSKIFGTGCVGRISAFNETEDGRYLISLCGVARFKIVEELDLQRGFRRVRADWQPYIHDLEPARPCLIDRAHLIGRIRRYFQLQGIVGELDMVEKSCDEKLINSLAMICPFSPCEKQALLEAGGMDERCTLLMALMDLAMQERACDGDMPRH